MILEFEEEVHPGNGTLDYCQMIVEAMELEKNQESPRMRVADTELKSQRSHPCTRFMWQGQPYLVSSLCSQFPDVAAVTSSNISVINCDISVEASNASNTE